MTTEFVYSCDFTKIEHTDKLTFKDLEIGDVFQDPKDPQGRHIFMKISGNGIKEIVTQNELSPRLNLSFGFDYHDLVIRYNKIELKISDPQEYK